MGAAAPSSSSAPGRPGRALASLVAVGLVLAATAAAAAPLSRLAKLGRILTLEDRRVLGSDELTRYLRDPDPTVSRRAALAAGRIGDPAAVPALIDLMNHPIAEVRQMAAFALGLIGDSAATERLLAALGDHDSTVRARSAEALGRIGGGRAAAAIADLVVSAIPKGAPLLTIRGDDPGSPHDPWLELRLGLLALATIKDVSAAEKALLANGRPRFDWWAATWVAMKLESPRLKPVLLAASASSDPASRALAARGLGALKDASAVELLTTLSGDRDPRVAVAALRALASIGSAGGTRAAGRALASDDLWVRRTALEALATLPPDPALSDAVVAAIGDPVPWIRAAALPALARTAPRDLPLVLSGLDVEPLWWVRSARATALGLVGDDLSLGILHSMLSDPDPRVIPAVLDALRKVRGKEELPTFRKLLESPDEGVRAAAASGIEAMGVTGQSADLAAAYRRSLTDGDVEARLDVVSALAGQKDASAREALERAAREDPSRPVRLKAGAALVALGGVAPPPRPVAIERPSLDAREAMLPYDPRPGEPVYTPRAFVRTSRGTIEVHLNVVEAPLTSATFMALAERGFYDGLRFHRVVPDFVIQGGDPRGDGYGGPGFSLRDEIGERPFGRGAVGIATAGPDTGGCQFFITESPQPHLDGHYTLFGWVASGMEVVDRIRPGDRIEHVEIVDGR